MSEKYPGGWITKTAYGLNPALGSAAPGIWTRDQVMQAIKAATWPTYDPYYKYVTLNLHGNGTNGAQNNTFLDSSTNALSITRNGNTTQGTLSPYGPNWSNYFNGSTDYLSIANNTALQMGSSDFTYECWLYPTSTPNAYQSFISKRTAAGYAGILLALKSTGKYSILVASSSSTWGIVDETSVSVTLNTWQHLAVVRSGSNFYVYLNGTRLISTSIAFSVYDDTSAQCIGVGDTSAIQPYFGYISNVRIVKGTAVYTAASFTPPTTPLTAISGTSLLTCQSNRFVDNSSNAFSVTTGGTPSVQRFSPFSPTAPYSTSVIGGSGYFDGTGDYLLTASNAAFTLAGDFTIEGWMYMTSGSNDISLFTLGDANASTGIQVYYYNSAIRMYSGATIIVGSITPTFNSWIHVAVVRSGTTVTLYLNGATAGTATKSTTYSGAFYTGASNVGPGEYMNGSISDIRVVKGTAVYTTASFTPPTAPLTAVTNTSYLLSFTNAGIYDNAMMNDLETVGSAQVSTSVVKFGTGSMSFNGTTSGLYTGASPNLTFGSGDFTIEGWVYFNSNLPYLDGDSLYSACLFGQAYTNGLDLIFKSGGTSGPPTSLVFNVYGVGGTSTTISTALNTWYHIAVTKAAGTVRVFLNGTLQGSSFANSTTFASGATTVGYLNVASYYDWFPGYIDDLRITKGYARYTANFTVQTSQWQDQ